MVLAYFLMFLEGGFYCKILVKSEQSNQFQAGKILKIVEHVSYSIRYCKTSLLIYSRSNSLSNASTFLLTRNK